MAAPFIVLGGKAIDYIAEKHWDKIPDRALHIRDPKKTAEKRKERERQDGKGDDNSRAAIGAAGAGAVAGGAGVAEACRRRSKTHDDDPSASETESESSETSRSKHRRSSERKASPKKRADFATQPPRTFDDKAMDKADQYQYPDARNPSYIPGYGGTPPPSNYNHPYPQTYFPNPESNTATPRYYEPPTWGNENNANSTTKADQYARDNYRNNNPYTPSLNDGGHRGRNYDSGRPAIRSRSSHQGDYSNYIPTSSHDSPRDYNDYGPGAIAYAGNDSRSHHHRRTKSQERQARADKVADHFSGTNLGVGASLLGLVAGGIAGYKVGGGSVRGRNKHGGAEPMITGLLGAVAGGIGANALERNYEKKKFERGDKSRERGREGRDGRERWDSWERENERSRERRDRDVDLDRGSERGSGSRHRRRDDWD